MPQDLQKIDASAFDHCTGIAEVHYTGSESDWKYVSIEDGNDVIKNAKFHFNCDCEPHIPNTNPTQIGDPDGDGQTTASDALEILKSIVGRIVLIIGQILAADVDGNGKVDSADALLILKKIVGKIDKFPVEE